MSERNHLAGKSSIEAIRRRFEADVERFSDLERGQEAATGAVVALDLIARAAATTNPDARHILDIGCGAGNYTLKLLRRLPDRDVTLVDLSRNMLARAEQRLRGATRGRVTCIEGDVRSVDLPEGEVDVILAGAVLHHLRDESEWETSFARLCRALRPGGSLWIFDLVASPIAAVEGVLRERYGEYLVGVGGPEYRDAIFAVIEEEDSPRPLSYQLDLMRSVGFDAVDVLHKDATFAAFGGVTPR